MSMTIIIGQGWPVLLTAFLTVLQFGKVSKAYVFLTWFKDKRGVRETVD